MILFTRALLAQTTGTIPQGAEIQLGSGVVEKLLIYKAPLACPHMATTARVTGTVVVGFDLGKHGEVLHPIVISGPAMLRKPVLDAVRKYRYKPYLLNGKAIEAETTVSVTVDTARNCPNN